MKSENVGLIGVRSLAIAGHSTLWREKSWLSFARLIGTVFTCNRFPEAFGWIWADPEECSWSGNLLGKYFFFTKIIYHSFPGFCAPELSCVQCNLIYRPTSMLNKTDKHKIRWHRPTNKRNKCKNKNKIIMGNKMIKYKREYQNKIIYYKIPYKQSTKTTKGATSYWVESQGEKVCF